MSEPAASLPAMDEPPEAALARTWRGPPGLMGWLCSVDAKSIGRRYIVTALVFFGLGGLLAVAMRLQLARPDNDLLGPDAYRQVFSTTARR